MVSSKMSSRIIAMLLLFTQLSQALAAPAISVRWQGGKERSCQSLVETFLRELRSMASDRLIQLDTSEASSGREPSQSQVTGELPVQVDVSCEPGPNPGRLDVADSDGKLPLRYLAKAQGFDSVDWLPIQQRFLRPDARRAQGATGPREISLAPRASAPEPVPAPTATSEASSTAARPSLFKQWWFWTIVGSAAAGGAYALTRSGQKDSSINVEIH